LAVLEMGVTQIFLSFFLVFLFTDFLIYKGSCSNGTKNRHVNYVVVLRP